MSGFVLFVTSATGAVVGFSGIGGATADRFAPYTEAGFTITPVSGRWLKSQDFGSPLASAYTRVADGLAGTIKIAGGTFSFTSADLASNNGASSYTFTGELAGRRMFASTGGITARTGPFFFDTIAGPNPAAVIDTLFISVAPTTDPTSINLDNIVLSATAVPEPATGLLLLTGISGVILLRRKHKA